ncbi:MAG: CRISPR-associated endonuclease Cas3'', partial [Chloroflexota bacterium]
MAGQFGAPLGAVEAAAFLGLVHDVGKLDPGFQAYLLRCEREPTWKGHGPDHKAAGSQLARQTVHLAAMAIQGHHGGLESPSRFVAWLAAAGPAADKAREDALERFPDLAPVIAPVLPGHVEADPLAAEFFVRLLFSALVDADFLDTERHFHPGHSEQRHGDTPLAELWRRFERSHATFPVPQDGDIVNQVRAEVYDACLGAATARPGIFR